jgi:hypothetical protein
VSSSIFSCVPYADTDIDRTDAKVTSNFLNIVDIKDSAAKEFVIGVKVGNVAGSWGHAKNLMTELFKVAIGRKISYISYK